ncbi:MAG: tetratricopeptide repeat protein [bacterium]|nr:tetratricopeptide repeat protein [bacterium]
MQISAHQKAKIAKYEELLAKEPNTLIFAALGSLYARQYEFERAVEVLDSGLQYFPNYFSARVLLAKCYLALNLFDAAIAELEKVLEVDPNNVSALTLIGDEYRNRGETDTAREYYERALELDRSNEEFKYKLHLLDEIAGVTPDEPPTGETLSVAPDDEPGGGDDGATELATVTLARIYIDQGLIEKAHSILDIVIQRNPENIEAVELRDQLTSAAAEGKMDKPTALGIAGRLEAVGSSIEDDEFDIDMTAVLRRITTDLKQALHKAIAPRPGEGTSGSAIYELNTELENGLSGNDELVMSSDLAEIYMIEFDLPGIDVLAGELGVDELDFRAQLSIENDDFVIGDIHPVKKNGLKQKITTEALLLNGDEVRGNKSLGSLDGIADAAESPDGLPANEPPDEKSAVKDKLKPEDILVYKPTDPDFDSEEITSDSPDKQSVSGNYDGTEVSEISPFNGIDAVYGNGEADLLELDGNPFDEEDEDFLGWLNSIKLKEI